MSGIVLDKIHTTPLADVRIKKNCELKTCYVASWCKEIIKTADITICHGKNWYVYKTGFVLTVNKTSYTVITASKVKPKIYTMTSEHYSCLKEFLYQAIYIPYGEKLPSREIIKRPEIHVYIEDFGSKKGDLGVVAEQNGQIIGACWTRIIPAYGHINDDTPELAISILPEFRGLGIGTRLMKRIFKLLISNGYKKTSLSVQKNNPAFRFYKRLGYKILGDNKDFANNEDYLMVKEL
jgi:ribosomal protein S18 acetylase RimI-like enzyme